jgi:hypothetical protein
MVEKIWNGGVFKGRNPSDMLMIGSNPGAMELLLSVQGDSFGHVFSWLHSPHPWGDPDNSTVWQQAPSFRAFMDSLYERALVL